MMKSEINQYRMKKLDVLRRHNKISDMIKYMDLKSKIELEYVFNIVISLNDSKHLKMYASKTDYRSKDINKKFECLKQIELNDKLESSEDYELEQYAKGIFNYVNEAKQVDNLNELTNLIRKSGNTKYLYLIWLYNYLDSDKDMTKEIINRNEMQYSKLIYENYSKKDKLYAINNLIPIIYNQKAKKDDNYNEVHRNMKKDVNDLKNQYSSLYQVKLEDFNLKYSIISHNINLKRVENLLNLNIIDKKNVLNYLLNDEYPVIGILKLTGADYETILSFIDEFCVEEYREIIKNNLVDSQKYTVSERINDAVYSYAIKQKEKMKQKNK